MAAGEKYQNWVGKDQNEKEGLNRYKVVQKSV